MKKSLAKNSIYNVVYKGVTALFPLVTTAFISRVLLAEGVGKVSYASTIVSYFAVVAALGLPQYGVKVIAQNDAEEEKSRAFSELFFVNFCSTVICIIAYYSLINFCGYFEDKRFLLNIMGIQLILNVFNIDWFYQGIEEYEYITTRSLIIKILSFLAIIMFVKTGADYIKYGFILCMATAGNYVLNVWNLRRRVRFSLRKVNVKKHLRPIFVLLALSLATEIYTMFDTVMIEHFHGDMYVGYYSNSVKVVRLVHTLSIALVAPVYPRICLYLKQQQNIKFNQLMTLGFKMIMIVSIPCVFGIEILSDRIVSALFGESFGGSIICLKILAPLIVIFSVAYFLGHIVLLAIGEETKILIATVIGAVINFSINCLLIPSYKQYGAAIASVTAELIITIILIIFAHNYYKLNFDVKSYASVCLSVSLMGIVVYISRFFNLGLIFGLLTSIFVGVMSYVILLVFFKNDIVIMIISSLQQRIKKR